jgi:serine phosphatase RsbU (regulator of sigma subunit)
MIAKNFADEVEIYRIHSQDETAGLSKDIAVLVDTVRLRTQEVLDQKEQISEAYDNIKHLSEIGQHVTANLKIEKMMEVLGKDLAELFDYAFFAIGVPNKHKKRLDFWAMDRNGVQFRFFDGFQEKNLLSVRAFEQNEEILVQNVQAEYTRYFAKQAIPEKYNKYPAQVYLPLNAPHRILGVFTVQAAAVMSYSAYHLSLLHNLAVYISIALENANIYRQLDEKREKLLDSINYAQRIQQAILPKITAIQRVFPDSFVFFQPCDIVSGDFYWYAETEPRAVYEPKIVATDSIRNVFKEVLTPKHVLVAADCTGHGVPGAFMSMIGNDLLNNIIIEQGITAPEVILTKLHEGIRLALKQKENENPDGMDVAICVVDFEQRMLEYAGAFHPLLQIKDGIVQLIRADKKPVGGWYEEREDRVFHKHQITLEGESAFYIFSDGFGHQLGRENRKKFMSINLQKILLDIHHKPMKAQQYILEKVLRYWTGKHRQNDDVLVIGFKIGEKDIARQHNLYADKLQIS